MQLVVFWFKFHWNLFPMFKPTVIHKGFSSFATNRRQTIFPVKGGLVYWRIYASPGLNKFSVCVFMWHDDVIKWKHFPRYWLFARGIHRSPVNSPNKGQWRGTFMFSLICAWIDGSLNNREAGDLKRHRAHYDVTVMLKQQMTSHRVMLCLFKTYFQ